MPVKRLFISLGLLSLMLLVSGCFPMIQNNRDALEKRAGNIKSVKVLPTEIKIFELSAGDVSELRDDWSAQARKNVEKALSDGMKGKGIKVTVLQHDAKTESAYADAIALYRAVIYSVYEHATVGNPNLFPDKVANFDYTIGPLDREKQKGEGLLIVIGSDEISSAGRKALRVVQAINPFAPPQQSGVTYVQVALIDRSGDLLWWRSFANAGGYDLRDPDSASAFIGKILGAYPGGGK